jgi:hypothetical protein
LTAPDAPPRELPATAYPAWAAYNAMLQSKQAHYGYLESLDIKYQHGGIRTLAERARLETLLATHDECVREFAQAIKALANADVEARDILLKLMTDLSEVAQNLSH